MLEDQVAYLLQRYLGNYIQGLSREALKISVWRGDVELTNMQLKPEALNALKLPVKVKAGFLGSVKLKVPWSRLGQEPVLVYLDHILILVEPATHVEGCSEDAIQEAKRSRVREMEMKLLESWQEQKSEVNASWLGSLINTIIGNLKLSITNIHIRYEDPESNPGHPFAAGATLRRLSAVTVDDSGKETFATGGALEHIQKSVELESLAFYFDSDTFPWKVGKPWYNLLPSEWIQIFEFGNMDVITSTKQPEEHNYILQPVTGSARYIKLQLNESKRLGQPLQKATVNLDDVTLCLSKDNYRDILKLADNFSSFNQRLRYAHYRPPAPIKLDPRSWWKYAYRVVVDEMKKASGKFSWEQVLRYARLRQAYVTLYASLLKSDISQVVISDNEEIDNLDRELDIEIIIEWRMLAHKFVEESTESDVHLNKQEAKRSWWSLLWSDTNKDGAEPKGFTEEDWERLNKVIGYKEGSDQMLFTNHDGENVLSFFEIHMRRNASKLISDGQKCLADLSCDGLDFSVKIYPETKIFESKLGSYRLLSPNGLLAESATSSDSLVGVFSYKPFGTQLDWSFIAKASPCYITYLKDSIDQIVSFFKSSTAISHNLALETAAAVQMTLDGVRRTAQQQVTRALKDNARFLLDLDIAAPKITIPTKFYPDENNATRLLLDLGHLMLSTQDYWEADTSDENGQYLQFNMILSDVSAFLVDGKYSWKHSECFSGSGQPVANRFLPVIDRCGIILMLQQLQSKSLFYPSTRISIRLPSLGFHFSPARYHRLMQVVKSFEEENADSLDIYCPWSQADFEGWVFLLSWKGVGNREATWQRRYMSLVGPFLYILEHPASKTYKQYLSLQGKQVNQVPVELAGNVNHVLAVSDNAQFNTKVVEDVNALILRLDNDDSCKIWQNRLQGSIYRSSATTTSLSEISPSIGISKRESARDSSSLNLVNVETLFVTGALDELKISVSCSYQDNQNLKTILLTRESCLFEFRAIGGQVELSIRGNDIFIGTVLSSLEIEDLFQRDSISIPRYLARSFIRSDVHTREQLFGDSELPRNDSEDQFFEVSDSLGDESFSQSYDRDPGNVSAQTSASQSRFSVRPPNFSRVTGLLPETVFHSENVVSKGIKLDSFVKAQIVFYHQDSPFYSNIDKKVAVALATLSFFCHRPTFLAILELVSAINFVDGRHDTHDEESSVVKYTAENIADSVVSDVEEVPVVKGLLGKGKSRIIFCLTLNLSRAQIFLVNEDRVCLATLSQNNLLCNIKVFPSSFKIKAALGNLQISDDSLHIEHPYYWVCDMRAPGGSSFVELDLSSFSQGDDDYCGYDYSLTGQLSEVRIVYLNRFLLEISSYFVGLAPDGSKGVVKLKDQISNSEISFTTSEIEGSPALKLDLMLAKPIIIMPQRTDSRDYLELDVLHITVQNTFEWHHGDKSNLKAVHLETLTIQVKGINLTIGSGDSSGESIIEDVKGLSIIIQRSLRDLFHQIPVSEAVIMVEELRASLSNKEYQIITDCSISNISEPPNIVPALNLCFGGASAECSEVGTYLDSDAFELKPQERTSWTTIKLLVSINFAGLHLHSGETRELPLATVQANEAWFLYKSNSSGESFLWATLKGFAVIDEREGTKEEFRHAIGKHERIIDDVQPFSSSVMRRVREEQDYDAVLTMLILDVKIKESSTSLSLCIQRPHLLVALDFLFAVTEFFAPQLRALLSDENDALHEYDAVILGHPMYSQPISEFSISPKNPLIVDDERFDHYVYDGKGGTLCLKDGHGNNLCGDAKETIIFVGNGKRLQFKNVSIKSGEFLDSCIWLGCNSSYSASSVDNVFLEGGDEQLLVSTVEGAKTSEVRSHAANKSAKMEYYIELKAIGPELTFYTTSKDVGESLLLSNRLLHAKLDVFCRLVLKEETTEIEGTMLGLKVECNGIRVLEPFNTSLNFSKASGGANISISVSGIFMNFSFSILRLLLAVEEDILAFIRITSKKVSVICSQFDKIGTIQCGRRGQTYAFWRPRPPSGFAILGDCLTPLNEPPSKGVHAVNTSFVKVKKPISYKLIWPPSIGNALNNTNIGCSIWFPIAPEGYVSMGCVVVVGGKQPPLSSSLCILACLVTSCSLKDCITLGPDELYSSSIAFWRVENSFGSFLPTDSSATGLNCKAYELRQLCLQNPNQSVSRSRPSGTHADSLGPDNGDQLQCAISLSSRRLFEAVATFKLIWWNRGFPHRKKLSVWRPMVPHGMVYFGDIAVHGYEPPNECIVLRDAGDDPLLKPPHDFQLVGQIKRHKKAENINFWFPEAPPGYVSLGCIASRNFPKHDDFSLLRCVRSDMVAGDLFPEESIWDTAGTYITEPFSIWSVGNEVGTFIVRRGFKKPPRRFALKLAGSNVANIANDIVVNAEVKIFSAAVYDDYGGLMVPLFNLSFSGIQFRLHERPDYLNSIISFSITGRSYNDKYDAWEPLIEPVEAFSRYQYDLNSPGAVSQLRITTTKDLNINVSASNINMILQAYYSWSNLSLVPEIPRNVEMVLPPYGGQSILNIHDRTNYHIIPRNNLGQDIYIRASKMNQYSTIIKMSSGDNKPVKIPASYNMLDSHLEGRSGRLPQSVVSVIISSAELIAEEGLGTGQYIAAVHLFSNQLNESVLLQQTARTCGSIPEYSPASRLLLVKWDEIFFFKIDFLDHYILEIIVNDLETGESMGLYSAPLLEVACKVHSNSQSRDINPEGSWRELLSEKSMVLKGDKVLDPRGRIKFAVNLTVHSENEVCTKKAVSGSKPGFVQISPTPEGPWTTVRLNYAMPSACCRLGNNVIASELTVKNGTRYVNIRSLVSVTNNSDFVIDLRLKSKESSEALEATDDRDGNEEDYIDCSIYDTDELFEIEKYVPSMGWVSDYPHPPLSTDPTLQNMDGQFQGTMSFQLPAGWECIDDWHIDKSLVNNSDGWVYAPDVEHLQWPESVHAKFVNHARQRRWVRHRKYTSEERNHIPLNSLKPGDTISLPLQALVHPPLPYFLQLRPRNSSETHQYSWSTVKPESRNAEVSNTTEDSSEIYVSALCESEKIVYSSLINGSLSGDSNCLWFCFSIKAMEVGKDIHSNPIHDWNIIINSPLSVTNYLLVPAEYSILGKQLNNQLISCFQQILSPGETVKIFNVDLQDPLYLSVDISGWVMMHEPVLISHPQKLPSQTIYLRSSFSERVVQIILDQTYDKRNMSTRVRAYAPYWIASDRCPPLSYRIIDLSDIKEKKWSLLSMKSNKTNEKIVCQITNDEFLNGCTIASAMSFKHFSMSVSIEGPADQHFGPVKDLSPLADLDGSFDIYAIDADSNCMRIFISSRSCSFQAVPTKVISVRPFITFTNRIGRTVLLKFSDNDQPKVLSATDYRASFLYHYTGESEKLQFKLEDTEWSSPVEIVEDNFTMMLKRCNGDGSFLRVEIRGYEEGSRFLVVFRLGSSIGPMRIENRTTGKKIDVRQSGSDDHLWFQLDSLSSTNFSWVNPYCQRHLDICIHNDSRHIFSNISLEDDSQSQVSSILEAQGVLLHVLEAGDIKIIRFTDKPRTEDGQIMLLRHRAASSSIDENTSDAAPMELIVELGLVGISVIDHKPRELLFLHLEKVFISYSMGYNAGNTSRFKIIVGQVQLDNQLPLTVMPVLLAPEHIVDTCNPVFKTTVTISNEKIDGTQLYPYVYVRVMDKSWRLNIHEPIIWSLIDFYKNLHIDRLSNDSEVMQVDPEIRIDLIDISEIRLKLALETTPNQRPVGVLGMWSPILSAVGNALKIQIHLRKVVHKNRFMRKSSILPSIQSRIKRDLIHDPLHLIFSVDVLGMTKSTLASLSKGFAELSTDGQFLQLRSKQVWSRRITGVSDGILQGTEALAQGVAFGVTGMVRKPIESARQHGLLGLAHGLGHGFIGFIAQPVSGALDFVSLTVDGINASFSRCLELLGNKASVHRIRNPRAIHVDGVLREYSETKALGQMILYLAEASRHLGCSELFKEPSKYAWSDYYEDHFIVPNLRIVLVTNKRVILLQCLAPDKMDERPCKIMWDVPWEEIMALELVKAGFPRPSYLLIHLKNFRRKEVFVRLVKCSTEEGQSGESQAVRICSTVHKMWRAYQANIRTLTLKVPSSQRYVHFACNESDGMALSWIRPVLKPREFIPPNFSPMNKRLTSHNVNFKKIWSSEEESKSHCTLFSKQVRDESSVCSIWRALCPEGYTSVGDIARIGIHPPTVATIYQDSEELFACPVGYDLVWRNCAEDYDCPVSIWHPRAPEGFISLGCVAVDDFQEPDPDSVRCVSTRITEEAAFENQAVWTAPDSYPWSCYIYQVQSEALQFVALRQHMEKYDWKPMRVSDGRFQELVEASRVVDSDQTQHIGGSSRS